MQKHAEPLHTIKVYKICKCRFYTNFAVFKIDICVHFKCYLHKNEALHTPTFNIKMDHLNIVFRLT